MTDRGIVAEYNAEENTIYINEFRAAKKGPYLTFAVLHEFQHAIQVENGMNLGMNANWINSVAKTTKANIIADVRKHRPELFTDVAKGSKDEANIVNNFVYYSSGESTAYGIDASQLVNYYPTVVNADKGIKITFPWGSTYRIDGKLSENGQSIVGDITSAFDKIFEKALFDKTTETDIMEWRNNMRSVFIANDGSLRAVKDGQTHYLIMSPITNNGTVQTAVKFFDALPEVSVQKYGLRSFVVVRVGDSMSSKAQQSLLIIMDTLYSQNIPFELGPIFEADDGNIVLNSERAENSDELLNKYNVLRISEKQVSWVRCQSNNLAILKPNVMSHKRRKRHKP